MCFEWFRHIHRGSSQATFETIQNAITLREHNHQRPVEARAGSQQTENCVAIHLWHTDIQENDGRSEVWLYFECTQSLDTIGVGYHINPLALQCHFQDFPHCKRIVNDHDCLAHLCLLPKKAFTGMRAVRGINLQCTSPCLYNKV